MPRCRVCNAETAGGFVLGPPPAPDRQKLGLCPEHDTPRNRELLHKEYELLLRREADLALAATPPPAKAPAQSFELRIRFLDGGVKIVQAGRWEVDRDAGLLVLGEPGRFEFHPLQHIRSFEVVELPGPLPQALPEPD